MDTTTVFERVWADGPPWFSCAEVRAKLRTGADSGMLRQEVGNWAPLVSAGWAVLRDTVAGPVRDPGWCAAQVVEDSMRQPPAWTPSPGAPFPTGAPRRGWVVRVGRRQLVVTDDPQSLGADSAVVRYAVVVAPNASGRALRADADTTRYRALLVRRDDRWMVAPRAVTVRR